MKKRTREIKKAVISQDIAPYCGKSPKYRQISDDGTIFSRMFPALQVMRLSTKRLDFCLIAAQSLWMRVPSQPVSLSLEQIAEIHQKLAAMRHDVNNYLALIMAATELMRYKPEALEKMLPTLRDQPVKIGDALQKFSEDFDALLGMKDA